MGRRTHVHLLTDVNVDCATATTAQKLTTTYVYDELGRLREMRNPESGLTTYRYDLNGNRTQVDVRVSSTETRRTVYVYDDNNHLEATHQVDPTTDAILSTTSMTYDFRGNLLTQIDPTGVTTCYEYYSNGQLHYLKTACGTAEEVFEAVSNTRIDWIYNDAYRLEEESRYLNGSLTPSQTTTFTYDGVGNRLTESDGTTTLYYHYDALDQLQQITENTLTGPQIADYTYDARGNVVNLIEGSQTTTYTWDARNQLSQVNTGTDTISYQYDAHGRRVQQTLNGTVTNYLWDQFSPWGDVALETDNSGSDVVRYVMGGTELLAQVRGSNVHFYLNDIQNSTRMLADATGTIDATYSYDAFGDIHAQTGIVDNDYLYTGQQYDAVTDLYSLRARYYDPGAGRFLSRDTWAVNYQNPFELNRYVYAANNPATYSDPSGYFAFASNAATYRNTAATSGALFLLGLRTAAMYATIDLTFEIISRGLPYMDDVLDDLIDDTITREGQIGVPELDSIWTDYINTLDMTGLDGGPSGDGDPDRDGDPDPEECCPIPDPGPGDDENDDDDPQRVLFGQKRISKHFDSQGFFGGNSIYQMALKLEMGLMTSDQLPIRVFERESILIAINDRSLAALSLAGLRPTNTVRVQPTPSEQARLGESISVPANYGVPGNLIQPPSEYTAVTPSQSDLTVLDVIKVAD